MALDASNQSYALAFRALELLAGSRSINFSRLHHRYREKTPRDSLRLEAAQCLRAARKIDRATAAKVWRRHRSQV